MAFAERDGDDITIRTVYRDKDLIRAVPGSRYNEHDDYLWRVPLSWAGCLTLLGIFRERLEIGPGLREWWTDYREHFVLPALTMRIATVADGDADLYPFQRAGVKFLSHVERAILTDEMGTGKTPQTIRTLVANLREGDVNPFPALVVAPNNMKATWKREFARWWPGVEVVLLEGGRVQRLKEIEQVASGQAHVLVANWEALRGHSRLAPYGSIALKRCIVCDKSLRGDPEVEKKHPQRTCEHCPRELNDIPWQTVIADEAHKAKDPRSKQTRALWALRTDATRYRYALTGTPIADAPQDLWSALHFIDPRAWPVKSKYVDRWCLQSFNPFGAMTIIGLKPETRDEFFQITDPFVRRMPKALVLPDLPPKVYTTRFVDMSPKQKKAYAAMRDDMVAHLDDGGRLVAPNPLTQLTRLTQFASSFAYLEEVMARDPKTGQMVPKLEVRLSEPSCKVDALLEIHEELGGKPAGVFAQSRQLIELASARLERYKIPHVLIVGGQTAPERQISIDRFQSGDVPLVLATVGAGGVGITLTRGDTCVFLQRSWSAIDNKQAEDRFHRIGSEVHESIQVIDVVSNGTIELHQRQALEAKHGRMEEIVRDQELMKLLLRKD